MYDLVIIGGGPVGVAAGVYAARKRLKTLFVTYEWGGQSTVSDGIQNWIGTIKISGEDLAKSLEAHLRAYAADVVADQAGASIATVTSAQPIAAAQLTSLGKSLAKVYGRELNINLVIDPAIIGGLRVQVGQCGLLPSLQHGLGVRAGRQRRAGPGHRADQQRVSLTRSMNESDVPT